MALHIDEQGEGPAVVLLHGLPSLPSDFDGLARALAHDYRVLVPHMPGYGSTPELDTGADFDRDLALLHDGLQSAGVVDAAFVGVSGGVLRTYALLARGLKVGAIVSLGGLAALTDQELEELPLLAAALRQGADLTGLIPTRFLGARARAQPRLVERALAWAGATRRERLADELAGIALHGPRESVLALRSCPLLARVGEEDLAAPPERSREMVAAGRGEAALEIVPGAGHALLIEDEADTVASVVAFLSRVWLRKR